MFRTRALARTSLVFLSILAVMASASDARGTIAERHTRLVKSEPAVNDTLTASPKVIRLWFSEKVELPVTNVKLSDATGASMTVSTITRPDTGETAPIVAGLAKPLAGGSYLVTWTTAAKDGHPANGSFGFVVRATR